MCARRLRPRHPRRAVEAAASLREMRAFARCRRRWFLEYCLRLEPTRGERIDSDLRRWRECVATFFVYGAKAARGLAKASGDGELARRLELLVAFDARLRAAGASTFSTFASDRTIRATVRSRLEHELAPVSVCGSFGGFGRIKDGDESVVAVLVVVLFDEAGEDDEGGAVFRRALRAARLAWIDYTTRPDAALVLTARRGASPRFALSLFRLNVEALVEADEDTFTEADAVLRAREQRANRILEGRIAREARRGDAPRTFGVDDVLAYTREVDSRLSPPYLDANPSACGDGGGCPFAPVCFPKEGDEAQYRRRTRRHDELTARGNDKPEDGFE